MQQNEKMQMSEIDRY